MEEERKKAVLFGMKKKKEKLPENKEQDIGRRERLEQGQILCVVIIEILGKPKEHVTTTIREYVKKIKETKGYDVVKEHYSEPEPVEKMFSVYAEIELWIDGLNKVLSLCYDYMPSSIEIVEPEMLKYRSSDFSGFINDMQARIHNIDMLVKNLRAENMKIKVNMHYLLRNSLLVALAKGEQTIEQLSKVLGIPVDGLSQLLAQIMEEEKRIKTKGDVYFLDIKNE